MPIYGYPFLTPTNQGAQIGGPWSLPFLWIRVTNPDGGMAIITLALIDTGSTACAFPSDVARRLGHDLQAVNPKVVHTANRETTAFPHTSRVEVLGIEPDGSPNQQNVLYTEPDQLIDYTCGLEAFLLGQQNFLGRFVLKIDYPRHLISLRLPQKTKPPKKRKKK